MIFIGADPGLHGAFAVYDSATRSLECYDMPRTHKVMAASARSKKAAKAAGREPKQTTKRAKLDLFGLHDLFDMFQMLYPDAHVIIEEVQGRGNQMGGGTLSHCVGAIHMAVVSHGMAHSTVLPGKWKKDMGLSQDKSLSVPKALSIFPAYSHLFYGPKGGEHEDRAEAALMGYWGSLNR